METNEKGRPTTTSPVTNEIVDLHDKDKQISKTTQVLQQLISGEKFTAFQMNLSTIQNDSRKHISMLRKAGYPISDRMFSGKRKLYWLPDNYEQIMIDAVINRPKTLFDGID